MKIIRKALTAARPLRALPREKRGNAALILGASLPLLVGSMGLGVDFTQWVVYKRSLQGAADAAALAGARTRYDDVDLAGVTTEATKVINTNSGVARSLTQVNFLASPGQPGGAAPTSVEVVLEAPGKLYFAGLFLGSPPTIRVRAVAGPRSFGKHCFLATHPTAEHAFEVSGSGTVNSSCGAMANSTDDEAFLVDGSATLDTSAVASAGGIVEGSSANITAPVQTPNALPQVDPFGPDGRDLQQPTCTGTPTHDEIPAADANGNLTFSPGCYDLPNGGLNLTGSQTVTFLPGVHVFNGNKGISFGGSVNVVGNGVSIVLTDGAWMEASGSATINMSAMTTEAANALYPGDANRAALAGVLLWQTEGGQKPNSFTGSVAMTFNGAFYIPDSALEMTGSLTAASTCVQLVASTLLMTGSSSNTNVCPPGDPNWGGWETVKIVLAE